MSSQMRFPDRVLERRVCLGLEGGPGRLEAGRGVSCVGGLSAPDPRPAKPGVGDPRSLGWSTLGGDPVPRALSSVTQAPVCVPRLRPSVGADVLALRGGSVAPSAWSGPRLAAVGCRAGRRWALPAPGSRPT